MKRIILGSQSPRRREIFSYFSLPFEQMSPNFDEERIEFKGNPEAYCAEISKGKANLLHTKFPDAIIITADTIVYRDGKIYGKPATVEEAFQSFSELVGKWHTVYTAVTICFNKEIHTQVEWTSVLFNALNPDQIRHYISRVEWADKAGGYAIQMAGGLIVNRIEGCYYNVMGLPINTLRTLLLKADIDLWNYI